MLRLGEAMDREIEDIGTCGEVICGCFGRREKFRLAGRDQITLDDYPEKFKSSSSYLT